MTVRRFAGFLGEVPRTIARMLPDMASTLAVNTRLDDSGLTPVRMARYEQNLGNGGPFRTIYKSGTEWLAWSSPDVDVAPGPVASNRLYITGDGAPKIRVEGQNWPLALPFPDTKLTATIQSGAVNTDLSQTLVYSYTWVTAFDEESEPAPLSDGILWSPNLKVVLTGFKNTPPGRNITRMRIYRSQTAASGATALYFVAERLVSATDYVDDVSNAPINEPIKSTSYNAPPDTLKGIIAGPNGMMAAFDGKKVYFCEPYIPHAWPESYILTADYAIVGLVFIGNALVVTTEGTPYIVTGTAPENMTMDKLEVNLPCIAKRSIVDLGYAAAYASHDGLVSVTTANGAAVATGQLFTRDQWMRMNPYSFIAGQVTGKYMVSYNYTDEAGVEQRGMMMLDLRGEQPGVVRTSDQAEAMHYDIATGSLFILKDGTDVYEWDAISQPYGEQVWWSRPSIYPSPVSFGAILIEGVLEASDDKRLLQEASYKQRIEAIKAKNAANFASGDIRGALAGHMVAELAFAGSTMFPLQLAYDSLAVSVYANERKIATITSLDQVARLPAVLAERWQIEIRSNMTITAVSLASTPTEMGAG